MSVHVSVLPKEAIEYLDPQPGQHFIDCTLGGGGHTMTLLEKTAPEGKVLALDQDEDAIERFELLITNNQLLKERVTLVNDNFRNLKTIYASRFHTPVSGILCDLGLSSDQLEVSNRGFSFQKSEPLEMTFSSGSHARLTAADILSGYSRDELERIFRAYAQEARARDIAHAIVTTRKQYPITTTDQLVKIVESVKGSGGSRIHPATKVFQALRIAVNDELGSLEQLLPDAVEILESGGRLAIISFHELEDRMVKRFFQAQEKNGQAVVITKKPIAPSQEEIRENPRARSAKLRVLEKT